jgi:hypothetical protein
MGPYDGFATLAFGKLRQNAAAIRFVGRLVIPYRISVSAFGDHALTEVRRFQMAEKPPSTANSTPFT